jgi:hypothetical protein
MKKILLLVLGCLFIFEVASAQNKSNLPCVGIVGNDGILVPIGTYSNGKWTTTWPELTIDDQPEIEKLVNAKQGKMRLQDIPNAWLGKTKEMPTKWYLWSGKSEPSPLEITEAVQYYSHCEGGWALKTNISPAKEEKSSPTPKLGVATSFRSDVIPMVKIVKESKEAVAVIPVIVAKFEEKERASIKSEYIRDKYLEYTGHPVSPEERSKAKIEITKTYKTLDKIRGKYLYFVEAQRKYYKPSGAQDADCYSITSLNSWLTVADGKVIFLSTGIILSDCYGKEMISIIPDVVLSIEGKYYGVSEYYGYEGESYSIDEIHDDNIEELLSFQGGGC